jgi:FkbM family methyltransferase
MRVRIAAWEDHSQLLSDPEETALEDVINALKPGSVVIDVGAGIGRYALMAADRVGPGGRIVALETRASNFTLLSENASANGLHWIQPLKLALSADDATAQMTESGVEAGNGQGTTVVVRTLASLLTELNVTDVDLLNIDVDNAPDVLQGALPALRSGSIKQIVCRIHKPGLQRADVEALLRRVGYSVFDLGNNALHGILLPPLRKRTLRLAVVGCGGVSVAAHIPAATQVREVSLAALVDADLQHAQALASRFGIDRAVSSLDDVGDDVDAVILATPPHIRGPLALQALKSGLHVLCEKPMANTSTECQLIVDAGQSARRTVAVGHNYRFFPNREHVWNLWKSKQLGGMIDVTVEQGDPFGGSSRTLYTLRREMVPGGVLFNDGVHTLDMLFWMFGEPDSFEYRDDSLGGLESNVDLTMNYSEGGTVHFKLSRTCSLSNTVDMRFEYGSLSFPIYDMAAVTLNTNGRSRQLVLHTTPWDFVEIAAMQLRDFAHAAMDGVQPKVSGEDGLRTVRFIESCYASRARRSRPTTTPPPGVPW